MAIPAEQVNYATTALSLFTLITRIVLSLWRQERIDTSFFLVATSILVVIARIIVNTYYLAYGNASDAIKHAGYFDESNLQDIKTGSILVLAARVLMTTVLWLQIGILLLFYSRITFGINWVAMTVKITWAAVAGTFIAVILITFLECRPISLYWQISPDPGYCVHAYAQLLVQAISNISLDLLLIAIAWPIAGLRKRTIAEHVTLYTLFALGTFCITISIIRVVSVQESDSSQTTRSLWASVQMFVSTFVANAPSIYGSVRALRMKKPATNSAPAPTIRNRRVPAGLDSWMKMDDDNYIALTPMSPPTYMLRPLPPAATFYDPETAPAPYSHRTSRESGTHTLHEPDSSNPAATSSIRLVS
ncbi:hypothetical protein HD806DRAFT_548966 [Xylariaceae sp. AK1471]|nr:hypothetical protein HD806DRAFT_548966 [Xylariaceae sp. AK1471]